MQVVFVVGTTASGKSAAALNWALKCNQTNDQAGREGDGGQVRGRSCIVNCDSIQVYQGLDIGSAKPSSEERKLVPHFLFDFVAMGEELTAGQYQRQFFEQMRQLEGSFSTAFVVGGTGFYFQAIEKGMYPIGAANADLIAQLEQELKSSQGAALLYQELQARDPETAAKISPQDHYRLARAIEMMRTHGMSVTEIKKQFDQQRKPFPYPLKKIGIRLPKEQLLLRVQVRTQQMLKAGLLNEVNDLLAQLKDKNISDWAPMHSVGYAECVQYLQSGQSDLAKLEALIVQNTMKLAKKQRTWFQRDPEIHWLDPEAAMLTDTPFAEKDTKKHSES